MKITPVTYSIPKQTLQNPETWAEKFQGVEKGVIVLGANGSCPKVSKLSEKLGWPILSDIVSTHRELADPRSISYFHPLLKLEETSPELILYFGDACVSKDLLRWMGEAKEVLHIAPHAKRNDPLHKMKSHLICDIEDFCENVANSVESKPQDWFSKWQQLSQLIPQPRMEEKLTEVAITKILEDFARPEEAIFFGNSMPIRDADRYFFPKKPRGPIYANRGLSGIDGNIATIAGIAHRWPVTAIVGDQTLLHDLNSLAQLKKTRHPVRIILINNGGGGIFSFVAIKEKAEVLDPYFAAAHSMNFEHAALLFELSYAKVETEKELRATDATFIEVITNREENLALHQKIDAAIEEKLCSSFCTDF